MGRISDVQDIADAVLYLTEARLVTGSAPRGWWRTFRQMVTREGSRPASGEQRLKELGLKLPAPPQPFGIVEAVQTGNLFFLSGMLPTEGHRAKFMGPAAVCHSPAVFHR
jgi:hypothetical protein